MPTDEELKNALGGNYQLKGSNGHYKINGERPEDRSIPNDYFGECINDIVGGGFDLLKEQKPFNVDKDLEATYKNEPWYKNSFKK
jgi:hypothetical protein